MSTACATNRCFVGEKNAENVSAMAKDEPIVPQGGDQGAAKDAPANNAPERQMEAGSAANVGSAAIMDTGIIMVKDKYYALTRSKGTAQARAPSGVLIDIDVIHELHKLGEGHWKESWAKYIHEGLHLTFERLDKEKNFDEMHIKMNSEARDFLSYHIHATESFWKWNIVMEICAKCHQRNVNAGKCTRCKAVKYCSKQCQRDHWKKHKSVCKP